MKFDIHKYTKIFNNIAVPAICGYGIYHFYLDFDYSYKVALFMGLIMTSCVAPIWRSAK